MLPLAMGHERSSFGADPAVVLPPLLGLSPLGLPCPNGVDVERPLGSGLDRDGRWARDWGGAIALDLAAAKSAVGIVARSRHELEETAAAITGIGGRVEARTADVVDLEQVETAFGEIARELGPPDLLVNNAGIGSGGPVWEADPEEWWRVIEVNLRGPFLCSRAVLPAMRQRDAGRIVNVASNVGLMPAPTASSYSCSKAALVRLTDCLALELLQDGVRVFAVSPGMVRTRMMDNVDAFRRQRDPNYRPLPESMFRAPELVAALTRRIAAGEFDALNGRYIHVDDDLDDLLARQDEIVRDDLHVMRLRR